MTVRFTEAAPSRIYVNYPGGGGTAYDRIGRRYQEIDSTYHPSGRPLDTIPLAVGDSAVLPVTPENTCTLYVALKDGVLGVTTHAFFYGNIAGDAPMSEDDFTPAVRDPAQPRP